MAAAATVAKTCVSTSHHCSRHKNPSFHHFSTVPCSSHPSKTLATVAVTDPAPLFRCDKSFAPTTIANLGPSFDFLGCAVDGLGDTVTLSLEPSIPPDTLSISSITSNNPAAISKLTRNPNSNCAGIAATAAMRMLDIRTVSLSLHLHKGLTLDSGLGSSAASTTAAAVAVNALFDGHLPLTDLVLAGLESEEKVSGYHADNVAPSLMEGLFLSGATSLWI